MPENTDVTETVRRMTSEERRQQIIDAAIAVFGAKGYVGTTTDDVARAASISQPYVVRLFGTKENLFLEALDSALERLLTAFRTVETDIPFEDRAERMGQAYIALLAVRGLHQILSHAFLLGAHPVIGPRARAGFTRVWTFLRESGFSVAESKKFLSTGMLINTLLGLRMTDEYGEDGAMTELFDECFPRSVRFVIGAAPRFDEPW